MKEVVRAFYLREYSQGHCFCGEDSFLLLKCSSWIIIYLFQTVIYRFQKDIYFN